MSEATPGEPVRKVLRSTAYPVLANQLRCSTGFTYAVRGILRMPRETPLLTRPDRAKPVDGAAVSAVGDDASQAVLDWLQDRVARGLLVLPHLPELARALKLSLRRVQRALRRLEDIGEIAYWQGRASGPGAENEWHRAVQMQDGAVLRTPGAPKVIFG